MALFLTLFFVMLCFGVRADLALIVCVFMWLLYEGFR